MYSEDLMDRSLHPLHKGVIDDAEVQRILQNASCGDEIAIFLRVNRAGVVTDASWEGYACAIAQASAEYLLDRLIGKRLADLDGQSWKDVPELSIVENMPARQACALLPWEILEID